ncbi:DUF3325 domain-containing protein [Sphingobium xenophagum]
MLHPILLTLASAGFVSLCAGLPRYQSSLLNRRLSPKATRYLRLAGWLLVASMAAIAVIGFGAGCGLVLSAGYATVGAASAVTLTSRGNRHGSSNRR